MTSLLVFSTVLLLHIFILFFYSLDSNPLKPMFLSSLPYDSSLCCRCCSHPAVFFLDVFDNRSATPFGSDQSAAARAVYWSHPHLPTHSRITLSFTGSSTILQLTDFFLVHLGPPIQQIVILTNSPPYVL